MLQAFIMKRVAGAIIKKVMEKREIKKAQEHDQARRLAASPIPRRPGRRERVENHSVCGKPLPRSIEELAYFKAAHGSAPEGNRWYCECGLA